MKLPQEIDREIRSFCLSKSISYPKNENEMIEISEWHFDSLANAGMAYVIPKDLLPAGELCSIIPNIKWVYTLFTHEGELAIIEFHGRVLEEK